MSQTDCAMTATNGYGASDRNLTLELTGRAHNAERFKFSIKATLSALRLNELLDHSHRFKVA